VYKQEKPLKNSRVKKKIVELTKSCIVCASAGTGKTYTLVERYLEVLKLGLAGPGEIIAITFTEEAAKEMKERIAKEVNLWDANPVLKEKIIYGLGNAYISTVHSFCNRIIQENMDEIEIPYDYRIMDEAEENVMRDRFISQYLNNHLLRKSQIITYLLRFYSVASLRSMLNHAWENYFLLRQTLEKAPVDEEKYLKNAKELLAMRVIAFLSTPEMRDLLSKLVELGYISSPAVSWMSLEKIDEIFSIDIRKIRDKEVKVLFKKLREVWKKIPVNITECDAAYVEITRCVKDFIIEFLEGYRRELDKRGLLDFVRMEILAIEFLASGSERAIKFSKKFKFLLVDEFQDINPTQYALIEHLEKNNPDIVLFFVGDEKQSIYRFRGADVTIMNEVKKRLEPLGLHTNYRSVRGLVDFQNYIFPIIFEKGNTGLNFEAPYPDKKIVASCQEKLPVPPVEIVQIEKDIEAKVSFPEIEAKYIALRIKEMVGNAEIFRVKEFKFDTVRYGDIAILIRNYRHQKKYEDALEKLGIPFYSIGGFGFYDQPEIKNLISFMRVILNLDDEPALVGTLRSSLFGVSDKALMEFASVGKVVSGIKQYLSGEKNFELDESDRYQMEKFREMYCSLREKLPAVSAPELLQDIILRANYIPVLARLRGGNQRIANVRKLLNIAMEWDANSSLSPIEFIRRIGMYRQVQVREPEANILSEAENSVKIMTIHKSKGLDFPVVILPLSYNLQSRYPEVLFDPVYGILPIIKYPESDKEPVLVSLAKGMERLKENAEEKRIFYVGATRASSYLIIIGEHRPRLSNVNWKLLTEIVNYQKNYYQTLSLTYSKIQDDFESMCRSTDVVFKVKPSEEVDKKVGKDFLERIKPVKVTPQRITATEYADKLFGDIGFVGSDEAGLPLPPDEVGSVIHKALSWWDYRDINQVRDYLRKILEGYYLAREQKDGLVAEILKWMTPLLSCDNKIASLIREAIDVQSEVEISGFLGGFFVEGVIDLLITQKEHSIIVDFKTDNPASAESARVVEKYKAQLDVYAALLRERYKVKVKSHIVYFLRTAKAYETTVTDEIVKKVKERLRKLRISGR